MSRQITLSVFAALCLSAAGCTTCNDRASAGALDDQTELETQVHLSDLPAPVRATILSRVKESDIDEIEADREDGNLAYDIELEDGTEFSVAPDGSYLGTEQDDEDDDANDE